MAYFAELDENNVVLRVVVVADEHCATEADGIAWCEDFFKSGIWKQTWIDGSQRVNYADIDGTYDAQRDAFIHMQPHPSWILDDDLKFWHPPIPCPEDGKYYNWDEATLSWVEDTDVRL